MKQCAAATGIPERIQSQAKAEGCKAFRNARIDLEPLLLHIGPRIILPPIGADAQSEFPLQMGPRAELDRIKAEREKIKLAREAGQSILIEDVIDGLNGGISELFGTLDRIFGNELPPLLEGLPASEIRAKSLQILEEAKESLRAKFAELTRTEEQ